MSKRRNEDGTLLSPDAERFAARLAEHYAPEPPNPGRARAFDAALYERLDAPTRQPLWRPALATALLCAALGWLLLPPDETRREREPEIAAAPLGGAAAEVALEALATIVERGAEFADAEAGLLTANEVLDFDDDAANEFLPDDYLAIAGFLLDG